MSGNRGNEFNLEGAGFNTRAVRTQVERSGQREHSVPLYLTSSFVFNSAEQGRDIFAGDEDGPVYSRYGNPSVDEFVEKLCSMEGTEDGIGTASGMAAVFASIAGLVSAGDHIVCSRAVFGSTFSMFTTTLTRWGIETTFVAPDDPAAWERAVRGNTRLLFAETPSNPGLELIDMAAVADISRNAGTLFLVDNCFATPWLQKPVDFGADIVIHSATKFIDGQGRVLGGAILGPGEIIGDIRTFARQTGPALSPFSGWVLSKSLETLSVRMERHCDNAEEMARRLSEHPGIEGVRYPFLESHPQHDLARKQMRRGGGLVTFDVAGGTEAAAMRFINGLGMISRSSNLGDSRSIATHPPTTTHSALTEEERALIGIYPSTVRLSVGLEDVDDIFADIDGALGGIRSGGEPGAGVRP